MEAVELYLGAFAEQFPDSHGAHRKQLCLGRFIAYLRETGHSLCLEDLTTDDGQRFLGSLAHAYKRKLMSPQTKRRYKSALRTFGRFLFTANLVATDVFFDLD